MQVRTLQPIFPAGGSGLSKGLVLTPPPHIAQDWIDKGLAEAVVSEKPRVVETPKADRRKAETRTRK